MCLFALSFAFFNTTFSSLTSWNTAWIISLKSLISMFSSYLAKWSKNFLISIQSKLFSITNVKFTFIFKNVFSFCDTNSQISFYKSLEQTRHLRGYLFMITVAPQVHRDRPRRFDGPDTTNAYQITTTQKCLFCKQLTSKTH